MDFPNWTEGVFATNSSYNSNETANLPPSKTLLTVTLSVVTILTTFFNSLVITAIAVTRKLHHPSNYLICSLAVTDLLVAVLVMPFSIIYIQKEKWVLGEVVCTIFLGVDITCCTSSILHLAAIAIDRYRAITDAVEYSRKRTGAMASAMIAVAWFLSILISLPHLLWRHYKPNAEHKDQCIIISYHVSFTILSTLGAFYLPLLLILILYYKIYQAAQALYIRREASRPSRHSRMTNRSMIPSSYPSGDGDVDCGPRSPESISPREKSFSDPSTEETSREWVCLSRKAFQSKLRKHESMSESRRSQFYQGPRISGARERKAASTLGLIIGAFVICWLPFFVTEVVVNACSSCNVSVEMIDFITWLGYLNSLINPLIYTIFNKDFKKAFQQLIRCSQSHLIVRSA